MTLEVAYDQDLIAAVVARAREATVSREVRHEIRNAVLIYTGMAELAQEGDEYARARLPAITLRLRELIAR